MDEEEDFDDDDLEVDEDEEPDEEPEDDNADLAALLGVPERVLIEAIGGPWGRMRPQSRYELEGDVVFLGRAGISVMLVFDAAGPTLMVSQAVGVWDSPGTLTWHTRAPETTVHLQGDWLEPLAQAVDSAAAAKASELIICRYCSEVRGPEFAFGDECCSGCASTYLGVLF